ELNDIQGAAELVAVATKIDSDNEMVKNAEVNLSLNEPDLNKASNLLKGMTSLDRIVGSMNNRAIVFAKNGKFNQAITMYDRLIQSLPKDRVEEKSVILFNKGLACLRENHLDEGQKSLLQVTHPRLHARAK